MTLPGKVSLSFFIEANLGNSGGMANDGMAGEAVVGCAHTCVRSNVFWLVGIHPAEVEVFFLFLCVMVPFLWLTKASHALCKRERFFKVYIILIEMDIFQGKSFPWP